MEVGPILRRSGCLQIQIWASVEASCSRFAPVVGKPMAYPFLPAPLTNFFFSSITPFLTEGEKPPSETHLIYHFNSFLFRCLHTQSKTYLPISVVIRTNQRNLQILKLTFDCQYLPQFMFCWLLSDGMAI